ncbi:MAG TPA: hypothetical protein DCS29_05100 [Candidatus Magasanikbacteria bacterium]|nr:MAG: hypothetical protein A2479_03575 [Candidatus Magasanikbacteria bacterium RIFOXYC2_FULL_39_8]HAT04111.1 hypothetical protein [Candidatus Magasanikbacteria bacterium]
MKKNYKKIYKQWPLMATVFVCIFYIVSRVWMYIRFGMAGFGYDIGIYRHIVQGYFDRLGDSALPSFGFTSFSNALSFLGSHTDTILVLWYLCFGILLMAAFYVVVNLYTKHKMIALIGLVLFATSIAQFEFFWWYYYRNLIALFFVLLSLILLYYRSYFIILSLFVIGTIHPLSLIPLGLVLIISSIFDRQKRSFLLVSGSVSLVGIIGLNFQEIMSYVSLLFEKTAHVSGASRQQNAELTGQFIPLDFYIRSSFLYIIFAFFGLLFYWRLYKTWALFLVINTVLFIFGFLFYRRFLIYFDISALFFAAVFLYHFLYDSKDSILLKWTAIFFFALMFLQCGMHIVRKQPLISPRELGAIQAIDTQVPTSSYLMTINSHYAPWVQGFTTRDVIAPGMFEHDVWTYEEWQTFWYTEDISKRRALLEKYGNAKALYIFLGDRDMWFGDNIAYDPRISQVNNYIWQVSW